MLTKMKHEYNVSLANLSHTNNINKMSEVGVFKFNLSIKIKQAILGKEMVLNKNRKFKITNFFKPFDKWA